MNRLAFNHLVVIINASTLLTGCGAAAGIPQGAAASSPVAPEDSWMLPEAAQQDLLYVSNGKNVLVYSYPKGKHVGTLKHFSFAHGMCVDANENVYITDATLNETFEYAHGSKTRIKTLAGYGGPVGCSIDPTTGNLAVTEIVPPAVAVYPNASGSPTTYTTSSLLETFWCAYDEQGNLFFDGLGSSSPPPFVFFELRKGSRKLTPIKLDQTMASPGGVLWDGKYMAVGTYKPGGTPVIYRFAISGRNGTKMGTTLLPGAVDVMQFWVDRKTLVAPNIVAGGGGDAFFYHYPAGGRAYKSITKGIRGARGAVISLAPS